ncbi:MotA/TolQ/ExbB proton channel family protein [Acinetobacter sp. c1-l78]|uniref:MotA/TolQ/ExbB proton channel family protein n=1 Tax=Acinetobacter sp. c1-l78 TaxID=3342803 RepID=UPI0035B9471B
MDFSVYWQYADSISKTLYIILLVMSLASWAVFILRVLATKNLQQNANQRLSQAVQQLKARVQALPYDQRKAAAEQALLQQIGREKHATERGVTVLGTIASIAPFVGLFGTVWGIFHALVAVGKSGQAGLSQVAIPVGEALVMTGCGLAVAIPAVLAYNVCIRQNRRLAQQLQDHAHGLLIESILPEHKAEVKQSSNQTDHNVSKSLAGSQI